MLNKLNVRPRRDIKGFTLIELLVVIAIIALLLAIILPALGQAKQQAFKVICRTHLHQWGIIFESYLNDYNNHYAPGVDENFNGSYMWVNVMKKYYDDLSIRFCPKAKKSFSEGGKPPLAAWDPSLHANFPTTFGVLEGEYGSYTINYWVNDSEKRDLPETPVKDRWRRGGQPGSSQIPVMTDGCWMYARVRNDNPPPSDADFIRMAEEPGYFASWNNEIGRIAHDRHYGGINVLFMDSSIDTVKVKELWRLKWHRSSEYSFYDQMEATNGWPDWMK